MGFPRQVNVQGAPAVLGDFADANVGIRTTVDAGAGAFVAGEDGVRVGSFVWADASNTAVHNTGQGPVTGFIHRDQQAIITAYLADSTLTMYPGAPITVFNGGSFWARNDGSVTTTIGMSAYASYADGSTIFASSVPTSGSCSAGTVAKIVSASTGAAIPATAPSMTASISGTTMTVTAVAAGTVVGAGQVISGGNSTTGIVDTNTTIVGQLTGSAGSTGTYQVSISQNVLSTTITASGGCMTLTGANTSGVFAPGMTLAVASSGSLTAGTYITKLISATAGGAGTYLLSAPAATAVTAGTITAQNAMFLTVDGTSTGTWSLNDLLVGAGIPTSGTLSYISATNAENPNVTGTGGAGTYLATGFYTAVSAETITVNSAVLTKWVASSIGAPGELVKMTSQLNG
jgi:hypothetical protein